MQKIKRFVFSHFTWLFPALLLSCLIISAFILKDNGCLQGKFSPHGVLSLQRAGSAAQADSIIANWSREDCYCHKPNMAISKCDRHEKCNKAIVYAVKSINLDFGFIAFYVITLCVLLLRLNRPKPFTFFLDATPDFSQQPTVQINRLTQILTILVLLAGVCDVLENIFMLKALEMRQGSNYQAFTVPSSIKFICLGLVVVYLLVRASPWITRFFLKAVNMLWHLRIAVVSLLVLGFPLWFTNQGQDLLANINNTHAGPVGVFFTLSVLASLNWHLPKLYAGAIPTKPRGLKPTAEIPFSIIHLVTRNWDDVSISVQEKKAGRMLGILTFLIPSCAISNALDAFKADHAFKFISPVALLLLLTLLFYLIIHYNWLGKLNHYILRNNTRKNGKMLRGLLILIATLGLIKVIMPAFSSSSAPDKMTTLQVNLIIMAALFLMFIEYRSTRLLAPLFSGSGLNWFICIGAATCIAIFLLFNINPPLLTRMNKTEAFRAEATPLLVSAIIFHTVLFSLLLLYGKRFKTDIISILLTIGLVITLTVTNNFHTVRRVKKDLSVPANKMVTFREHLKAWLMYRKDEIERYDTSGGKKYPFFLVNSYGGGIRASAWTSMLFARINQRLQQNPKMRLNRLPGNFHHYTFASSGISGGTVGLALNTAYLYQGMANTSSGLPVQPGDSMQLSKFYQSDFLSPVTTVLFGRDILASVLGVSAWDDRAAILERTWERQASLHGLGNLKMPFRDFWNTTNPEIRYEIPLLFSNTYHAEKGVPGILASVQLDEKDFPAATIINNLGSVAERDLYLSTAAFISARFPYLTPSARFSYGDHFIDGGANEYSGCHTLLQVLQLMEKIRKEDPFINDMMNRVQVYHFNINNYIPGEENEKDVRNPLEFTLPLTAILQTSSGNTNASESKFATAVGQANSFKVQPKVEFINEEDCKKRYSPVLPLGWKISKEALQRMWKSVDREEQTPNSDFQRLLQVFEH
jgi:hypothetical protein